MISASPQRVTCHYYCFDPDYLGGIGKYPWSYFSFFTEAGNKSPEEPIVSSEVLYLASVDNFRLPVSYLQILRTNSNSANLTSNNK